MVKNTQVILACIPVPSVAVSTPSALRSLNISTSQHSKKMLATDGAV